MMQHIIRPLVSVLLVFELCGHGQTKTIVFNSYSAGGAEPVEAAGVVQAQNDSDVNRAKASESSGRGFSSSGASFPFSIHPDYLSKPVPVARADTVGYKTPKYIVYPSYSQSVRQGPSAPYYNAPVAMDRFAPGEAYGGTIYKLKKQKQPFAGSGGPFASIPAASFNSPVSVQSPNLLRPAASDSNPVTILAPSGSDGPSGGPPSPPAPPGPPSQPVFMPTPVPNSGEDTPSPPSDSSSEVALFPPNSHAGYLPPAKAEKQNPITSYLPPSSSQPSKGSSSDATVYKPSADLFRFPPNTNSSYLPPEVEGSRSKNPVTSYLPPPSGDITSQFHSKPTAEAKPTAYNDTAELFKFPPNVHSAYLSPAGPDASKLSATSYLPPPSGDPRSPSNLKPTPQNESKKTLSTDDTLHRFPPNVNSDYLPPDQGKPADPSATSYLPPASGDPKSPANSKPPKPGVASNELYKFPPHVQTAYLPSKEPASHASVTSYLPAPSGDPNSPALSSHPMHIPPEDLYKFPPNGHAQYLPPSSHRPVNTAVTSYLPPASGIPGDDAIGTIPVGPGKPQYLPPRYPDSGPPSMPSSGPSAPMKPHMHHPMMQPMMMDGPPDSPMDGPPTGPSGMGGDDHHHHDHHDHDHHHHHHDHDFPYFTGFDHDHYSDIIYDHDHFHHQHHDEPTTTPAPPPPPPPPETPRLKNYSYYYLSRTLWYVPLYFTLYFTVYVAILIIRSIARHKVNLPNQWVGNARTYGSIRDLSDAEAQRKATKMATFMMRQIEDFREKYL